MIDRHRRLPIAIACSLAALGPAVAQSGTGPQLRLLDVPPPPQVPAMPKVATGWSLAPVQNRESGVWYLKLADVVDPLGGLELLAGDDRGAFVLYTCYSGNWTAHECTPDGQWLAPTGPVDVDPRVPGREMYAGGKGGSLHQITLRDQPFARFVPESREIGHVAGAEFHCVVAADLAPTPGDELLAFSVDGRAFAVEPDGPGGAFLVRQVADTGGRVRDVVVVVGAEGPTMYGVSRCGDFLAMRRTGDGLTVKTLLREDNGLGRIAQAPGRPGVFYLTRDDGVLLRVAVAADGTVAREVVLVTDMGLRGVAAGRFFADGREAVAVYGYGKKVLLASRGEGAAWQAEEIYVGGQKGHWLVAGELDGRNGTDELVLAGFDGEVAVLAREVGYGLDGVPQVRGIESAAVPAADSSGTERPLLLLPKK
jgi:hypothetical protein